MTDTEQWLVDLEARAKAATPGPWEMKKDCDESDHMQVWDFVGVVCETPLYGFEYPEQWENGYFIAAANPAAVLRLVAMVRWMADVLHNSTGRINDKKYDVSKATWLITAYNATETSIVEKQTCPKN